MTARVSKNLPEKLNAAPKKDGRSYHLHGEEKEVARCIAESAPQKIERDRVRSAMTPGGAVSL